MARILSASQGAFVWTSISPKEIEISWNQGYANKSLRVRFRHNVENPLGYPIVSKILSIRLLTYQRRICQYSVIR